MYTHPRTDGLPLTRGKVVLVPFPFDDLSASKVRPAVCLTGPVGAYRHVILAFITSRSPDEPLESDVVLVSGRPGYEETGLRVSSVLRLHRLMTVSTALLSVDKQTEVEAKLLKLFDLGAPGDSEGHGEVESVGGQPCGR